MTDTQTPMQKRLLALPTKVNRPILELMKVEHLTEEVVSDVIEMVDIGGHAEHTLGYVVSYQHLVKNGVPMKDIIAMAKKHNRRINPRWSRTRWMEEHRKLSRIATLSALAGENVRYDLSKYVELLPSRFAGYVIKTSRRLGAEGLVQDHCVASYDSMVRNGHCCIVAVFIDKERWTVELKLFNGVLAVTQVKAKHNKAASCDVVDSVHKILGIEKAAGGPADAVDGHGQREAMRENLIAVCAELHERGIMSVHVSFDGYGDSGTIYDPEYFSDIGLKTKVDVSELQAQIPYLISERTWDADTRRNYLRISRGVRVLADAVKEVIEEHVHSTGHNWWDNDGGRGSYTLNVHDQSYDMDVDLYYTDSSCAQSDMAVPLADIYPSVA